MLGKLLGRLAAVIDPKALGVCQIIAGRPPTIKHRAIGAVAAFEPSVIAMDAPATLTRPCTSFQIVVGLIDGDDVRLTDIQKPR